MSSNFNLQKWIKLDDVLSRTLFPPWWINQTSVTDRTEWVGSTKKVHHVRSDPTVLHEKLISLHFASHHFSYMTWTHRARHFAEAVADIHWYTAWGTKAGVLGESSAVTCDQPVDKILEVPVFSDGCAPKNQTQHIWDKTKGDTKFSGKLVLWKIFSKHLCTFGTRLRYISQVLEPGITSFATNFAAPRNQDFQRFIITFPTGCVDTLNWMQKMRYHFFCKKSGGT